VRWVEVRRENFLNMVHGRGQIDYVEAAVTRDGEIVGLKVRAVADLGGKYNFTTPGIATLTPVVLPGPYRTRNIDFVLEGVYTNKTPVGAYRGAGRPEATYLMERIVDVVADQLQLDPADVRRKNFIPTEQFPLQDADRHLVRHRQLQPGARSAAGDVRLCCAAPTAGRMAQRPDEAPARHRHFGVSRDLRIRPWESATVRVERSGKVTLLAGTSPHGQGHVTRSDRSSRISWV